MVHGVTSCVTVRCDRCHDAARGVDGRPGHWSVDEQSGTCPACVAVPTCLHRGHDWACWQSMRLLGEPSLVMRLCLRCGRDEVTGTDTLTHAPAFVWGTP